MIKLPILKIKEFKNLWLAQATSQFGDAFYYWVFIFMVDHYTQSPVMVGFMGVAESIPFLLFSPYAGIIADRFDRKKIMVFADISSVFLLTFFGLNVILFGKPPLEFMFLTAFTLSSINAFFTPAKGAAIPMLVPKDRLLEANGLSTATQYLMPLIGLGLSGSVLASIQAVLPNLFFPIAIFINAMAFAGSAYFLSKLPSLAPKETVSKTVSLIKDYKEGLTYIFQRPALKIVMLLELLFFLCVSPFMTAYVTANRLWFNGEFSTLAILELSYSLAIVIGSYWIGRMTIRRIFNPFMIGIWIFVITLLGIGLAQDLMVFVLCNFIGGFGLAAMKVPMETYVQATVDSEYLGRINSILSMLTWGIMPLGMSLAGLLVEKFGVREVFFMMSAGFMVQAIIGYLSKPLRSAEIPMQRPILNTSNPVNNY